VSAPTDIDIFKNVEPSPKSLLTTKNEKSSEKNKSFAVIDSTGCAKLTWGCFSKSSPGIKIELSPFNSIISADN
jgi:hypothetical protein